MNFGFEGGVADDQPLQISLSQFCTMSIFHMAQALLMETMLNIQNLQNLGIMWYAYKKAWMTILIFEKFLLDFE